MWKFGMVLLALWIAPSILAQQDSHSDHAHDGAPQPQAQAQAPAAGGGAAPPPGCDERVPGMISCPMPEGVPGVAGPVNAGGGLGMEFGGGRMGEGPGTGMSGGIMGGGAAMGLGGGAGMSAGARMSGVCPGMEIAVCGTNSEGDPGMGGGPGMGMGGSMDMGGAPGMGMCGSMDMGGAPGMNMGGGLAMDMGLDALLMEPRLSDDKRDRLRAAQQEFMESSRQAALQQAQQALGDALRRNPPDQQAVQAQLHAVQIAWDGVRKARMRHVATVRQILGEPLWAELHFGFAVPGGTGPDVPAAPAW